MTWVIAGILEFTHVPAEDEVEQLVAHSDHLWRNVIKTCAQIGIGILDPRGGPLAGTAGAHKRVDDGIALAQVAPTAVGATVERTIR